MHQQLRPGLRAAGLLTAATVSVVAGCSAHATSAREGQETFVLRSDSAASNPDYSATAAGVFSAAGTFAGIGDGRNQSIARFADGTFIVTHPAAAAKPTRQTMNSHTCAVVFDQKGTFTVAKGTGAYKGISGYGTDTVDFRGVLPRKRDGRCNTSASAVPVKGSTHAVITAKGEILLPPS